MEYIFAYFVVGVLCMLGTYFDCPNYSKSLHFKEKKKWKDEHVDFRQKINAIKEDMPEALLLGSLFVAPAWPLVVLEDFYVWFLYPIFPKGVRDKLP